MKFKKSELVGLLAGLKLNSNRQILPEIEEQIADYYGVLNDDDNQIEWLEFIIDTYAKDQVSLNPTKLNNNNNLNNKIMAKSSKVQEVQLEEVVVVKTSKELIADAIAALSPEQLALIYPPIERANFVVRKSWLGRNQIITFVNNKNQRITYNHDDVLNVMLPKLSIMPCWIKREYWSQSTDMPANVRHLATIENLEPTLEQVSRP